MLFRRDMEPRCAYCFHGADIGQNQIICTRRGIMEESGNCNAFRYEPTKREPEFARSLDVSGIDEEDFEI